MEKLKVYKEFTWIERNNTIASIDSNESPKQQNKPPMRLAHTLSEDEAKRLDEECIFPIYDNFMF